MGLMHPTDTRYRDDETAQFLSDDAVLKYVLKIELAHIAAMERRGICPPGTHQRISERAAQITAEMWTEKQRDPMYKHNIRALMALVNEPLPSDMKRFFHLGLTSYDAVDNATVLALKDVTREVLLPDMRTLGKTLLELAERYRDSVQVGRSHGQHGEPTTFGREIAWHADRWGNSLQRVRESADRLTGRIAGAMGTKASLGLLGDAYEIEHEVLQSVGLSPADITTQITQPEDAADYYSRIIIAFGVLNNLANDMRHLARTEIGEIALVMPEGHGKSSTMIHKGMSEGGVVIGNPEDFENICGQYRAVMPHLITVLLSQESEHNRDLRNSSAERYFRPEVLNAFAYSVNRANATMRKLRANADVMRGRVENAWHLLMEPAYIALALDGEPNAQQYVRDAATTHGDFRTALQQDGRLRKAIGRLPEDRRAIFDSPLNYTGESGRQVNSIVAKWAKEFVYTPLAA